MPQYHSLSLHGAAEILGWTGAIEAEIGPEKWKPLQQHREIHDDQKSGKFLMKMQQ